MFNECTFSNIPNSNTFSSIHTSILLPRAMSEGGGALGRRKMRQLPFAIIELFLYDFAIIITGDLLPLSFATFPKMAHLLSVAG
jgi:hypothetical protein